MKILKFSIIVIILLFTLIFVFVYTKNSKTANAESVKVVYITDSNYVTYMITSIRSIIANKKPDTKIEIYVIGVNLSYNEKRKILKYNKRNVVCNIISFPYRRLKSLDTQTSMDSAVTGADNAKFFLTTTLNNTDKVIYLDGDTIILKDLSELYNTELGDNYIAAVDDWQTDWYDKRPNRYFNNGVMLLNLKKMREDNIESQLITRKKGDTKRRFVTQDIYNETMLGRVVFLPFIYDTFSPEYDDENVLTRIQKVLKDNYDSKLYNYKKNTDFQKGVVIIHYCGYDNYKPWDDFNLKRKSSRIWYRYAPLDFWIYVLKGNCKPKY